jgi:hypothetical protein
MKPPSLTVVVSARIPTSVAADWRAAAAESGLLMSDWLRQVVERDAVRIVDYRQPRPRRRYSPVDPALLLAVARIGNNCNQLAHSIHTKTLRSERIDTLRCLRVLVAMQRDLSTLVKVKD